MANRTRLNPDAIPYDETLKRLNGKFQLRPGDLITHEQLNAIIQPASENRYRGVIATWKRQVAKNGKVYLSGSGRARGIGLAVCTESEKTDLGIDHMRKGRKSLGRAKKTLDDVKPELMSSEDSVRFNLARRFNAVALSETDKFKEIAAPKAVRADNVRLLKKGA